MYDIPLHKSVSLLSKKRGKVNTMPDWEKLYRDQSACEPADYETERELLGIDQDMAPFLDSSPTRSSFPSPRRTA
jgi:hypothetical protein